MRLDDLDWYPSTVSDSMLADYQYVRIVKQADGFFRINAHGKGYWKDLEPLAAQAILYHVTTKGSTI
jgi:hypothetical protein